MMPNTQRGQFLNLIVNIVLPVLVLTRFSGDEWLGQQLGLIVALSFPLLYGAYDLWMTRQVNTFSVIGIISIVLTGGIGLLQLDNHWLAVKEAGIPLLIGCMVLASQGTRWSLMKLLLEPAINHASVDNALRERGTEVAYERRFTVATRIVAGSFFISATLNYLLAKIIVVSPPGTLEYNAELGRMTALSYPVIALPSMVIFIGAAVYLVLGIEKLTALPLKDIVKS